MKGFALHLTKELKKVTEEEILKEIKKMYDDTGYSLDTIAVILGVGCSTIRRLYNNTGGTRRSTLVKIRDNLRLCKKNKWGEYTGEKMTKEEAEAEV